MGGADNARSALIEKNPTLPNQKYGTIVNETGGSSGQGDRLESHINDAAANFHDTDTVGDPVVNIKSKHVPPPYVQRLSADDRMHAENALVRKLDIHLIPMLIIMYIMNYLDRNSIASARLAGLEDDLNLHGTQYQTSVSILFVGYLLMQIPSNLYLNKVGRPSIYLPAAMCIWGAISAATAGVQSFGGLITVRFMLGFVEAAYFPGCLYFLSAWYTRKELGFRTAMLYSGSLISGAFSGVIAAAITQNMDNYKGLRAWRWLFIIEGVVTVLISISAFFVLPDFPKTTMWLSDNERQLATWRLDEDIGEEDEDTRNQSFLHGAQLAAQDIKMWIMMVMQFCTVASNSVINFFPSVVATLGYGNIASLLLTVPPYVLCVLTSLLNAWHADRTSERYWHVTWPMYVAVLSFVLAAASSTTAARYSAMMIMVVGVGSGYAIALGWISNIMPRPPAKRAAALAAINAVSNASSIYASYLFPASAGPRYVLAMTFCSITAFITVLMATLLHSILINLNHKLDRGEYVEGAINKNKNTSSSFSGPDAATAAAAALGVSRSSSTSSDDGVLTQVATVGVPDEAAKRGFRFLI